ncbi:MAG: XdhC/CoxI family protein [Planctomycetota bacterium]
MNEIKSILNAVDSTEEPAFLATVVDVVGSSYRRPTARMLILPDGKHVGTISGGCLERDVCRTAEELTKDGPKLISFDTRRDSTNFNPRYDMGCSGIIYILVERVTRDGDCPTAILRHVIETNGATVCATVYQTDSPEQVAVGKRFTTPSELSLAACHNGEDRTLDTIWQEVARTGRPVCCEFATETGSSRVLLERVDPPKPLWIFGAGDDAVPLQAMAKQLGWNVTVVDHRASLLTPERFPNTNRICLPWNQVAQELDATFDTAALLMTHDFAADRTLIPWLLESDASYVGVLGPKSRTARVMKELHAQDRLPSLDSLDRFRTPVGLDIGASTPSEIAIAVLGEIIADSNSRSGGRLQARTAPIHEPVRHELIELTSASISVEHKTAKSEIA